MIRLDMAAPVTRLLELRLRQTCSLRENRQINYFNKMLRNSKNTIDR